MSWTQTCSPESSRSGILGELDAVRAQVSEAVLALRGALVAEWSSVAAAEYQALVARHLEAVLRLARMVDVAEGSVRGAQLTREQATGLPW